MPDLLCRARMDAVKTPAFATDGKKATPDHSPVRSSRPSRDTAGHAPSDGGRP